MRSRANLLRAIADLEGVAFGVVYTLPARSRVVAYSSADLWLRVVDDSGRRGWISQSLIRGQP